MSGRGRAPGAPGPGEVALWWVDPGRVADPRCRARWMEVLSPEERRRLGRFRFKRDQDLYLAAHALTRWALSHWADVPPGDWSFVADEGGKPRVDHRQGLPPLRFNLSHTRGMAACAVALEAEVGVDVEDVARTLDTTLAERFFSPDEVGQLRRASAARRPELFYEIWTLKEAYLKAVGSGLSAPLSDFTVHLDGPCPRISPAGDGREDRMSGWHLFAHRPGPGHRIAVAARSPSGTDLALVPRDAGARMDLA